LGLDRYAKSSVRFGEGVVCNPGIAFGLVLPRPALMVLSGFFLCLAVAVFVYFWRLSRWGAVFGAALVVSGALSNLWDRLAYGCVRDFLWIASFFPGFNLADAGIVVGTLVLLFLSAQEEGSAAR
jgi:signal peptidase II